MHKKKKWKQRFKKKKLNVRTLENKEYTKKQYKIEQGVRVNTQVKTWTRGGRKMILV